MYINFVFRSLLKKTHKSVDSGLNNGCGTETDSAPSDVPNTAPFVISLFDVVTEVEPTSHTCCCFYKQDRIERVKYMSPAASPK